MRGPRGRAGPRAIFSRCMARRTLVPLGIVGIVGALLGPACYGGATPQDTDAPPATGPDSGAGSTGGGAPTTGDATGGDDGPMFVPGRPVLPRLTVPQYRHSIEHLLGPALPAPPLEPDTDPYLFYTIGAASTFVSELGVQQYEEAADVIARAVFTDQARREALVGCVPAAPADACVQGFLTTFGLVFLAELGDKTQLATMSMAATSGQRWSVFAAAASALVLSSLIAVVLGEFLRTRVDPLWIQRAAAALFLGLGAWMLIASFRPPSA